jgi:hypothetical protein
MERKYNFYVVVRHNDGRLVWVHIKAPSKKAALKEWEDQKKFHEMYYQDKASPTYYEWAEMEGIYLVYEEFDTAYVDPDGDSIETFESLEDFEEKTGAGCL